MTTSIKTKANLISGCTIAGFLALFFLAVGCSSDHTSIEQERVELSARPATSTPTPRPSISVTSTPIEPATPVATPTPEPLPVEEVVEVDRKVTYAEAEEAFTEKRYKEAVDLFDVYTEQKSSNAWGFYMLGLSNWRIGALEDAQTAFENAIDLDPRHVKSWINLGRVHLDNNNDEAAILALDAASQIDPENTTICRLKGRAFDQQGDTGSAISAYKQALMLDENDSWSMNNMALVLIGDKRFEDALPVLARAVEINGATAPGKSSGQAIEAMESVAEEVLPRGFGYEWSGLSLEEIESGGQGLIVFALGIVFVFLTLAAQYESYVDPIIIMLTVPLAMMGALVALLMRGFANDVYTQIGFVMLIGIASKNAILIVEFANLQRERGAAIVPAVLTAAKERLRPILMTALSTVIGAMPLFVATGPGAAARQSLGTAIVGGMCIATVLSLFVAPVLYMVVKSLEYRLRRGRPESEVPLTTAALPPVKGESDKVVR